jgi:phospholipase/carboxylesterase
MATGAIALVKPPGSCNTGCSKGRWLQMLDGPRLAPLSGVVRQLVILLHGYGSNGADLISLAPAWRAALPDAAFTAPNGPENCPGFVGAYQWWRLTGFDRSELSAGAARAGPTLDAFLDEELARHRLSEDRLLLVGFSQGTMMALQVGLRRARPLAGIVGYSGALADDGALSREIRSRPPVLLVHGDADPMVPVQSMYLARDALVALDIDVKTHVSKGVGHSVDPAGIEAGVRFALRTLRPG